MSGNGTITREQILADHPLLQHLETIGVKLRGGSKQKVSNRCAAKQHKPDHWCVTIEVEKQVWHCNDCDIGGSIVDWIAYEKGERDGSVFKQMAKEAEEAQASVQASAPEKGQIVATYDYTDQAGDMVFQVVRLEPKSFRQRRPDDKGGWIWNMEGVTRVLYHMPEVAKATTVLHTEGEKDADNLRALGYCASTSAGGAKSWLAAYAETYNGKHVVIFPDNDTDGKAYAKAVLESLDGKALSVKVVTVPGPSKDISDYIKTFPGNEQAKTAIDALIEKTAHAIKPLPLFSIQELEERYTQLIRNKETVSLGLSGFLPTLGKMVRPLIPGQLMAVLASTGTGKTAILQTIARAAKPLATLFFELELPAEDMFERFVQMEVGTTAETVEAEYRTLDRPAYQAYKGLHHLIVCPESGLSTADIEKLIERSQLKFGKRPRLILVDYVGLIFSGMASNRYEAVSYAAEQLKVIAKRTGTIIIMASQLHRPSDKKKTLEVSLTEGKDSGSIENSASLVLGAWRPEVNTLMVRVLKNTRGRSGTTIECNFDGSLMRITERAQISTT